MIQKGVQVGIRKRKSEMNDKKIVKQRKVFLTKKKKLSLKQDFLDDD